MMLLVASTSPAHAVADPLIEGARQCTQYFPQEEKKNNIPTHLLAAIATTESGRYHDGLGMSVPWPWTINVEGKGYYFDTKAQAIAQTRTLLAQGRQSIDVGCMQVNLKHHPKAFANLDQAFEPATNVGYAAKFLRDNYATLGDWIKATAAYHSRTSVHGQRYLGQIERSWNKIVGKVAEARAGNAVTAQVPSASAAKSAKSVAATPRVTSVARPLQEARRSRVIQVRDEMRRSSEMVVVRAPAAPVSVVTVADAAAVREPKPVANSVRRVSLDKPTSSGLAGMQAPAPKFVFSN